METYKGVHWSPLIGTGKASSDVCLDMGPFRSHILYSKWTVVNHFIDPQLA